MYYTYILISKDWTRTYTGHTIDLDNRLREHNSGEVPGSRKYRPFEVLHVEELGSLKEAKSREKYYKNYRGRQKIKQIIENLRKR